MVSALKMLYILYVSYILVYLQNSSANETMTFANSEFLSSLRNLCPYSNFCQSSPLKAIPSSDNDESCCEKCSCDKDCYKTGSCCPDMTLSGPTKIKYPCKHLSYFGNYANIGVNFVPDMDISNWHHVIDDCPDTKSARSHLKCYKPLHVQDFAIVTDKKTGKMYRNKHCAECNRIKEYFTLKQRVRCNGSLTSFSNAEEMDQFILKNCFLTPLPPDTLFGISHCIPDTNIISECNVTGYWEIYDKDIEKGCMTKNRSWNTLYRTLSDDSMHFKFFSNVFCFLCNTAKSTNKSDVCRKEENRDSVGKSPHVSLYAVLDSKPVDDDKMKEDKVCESSEIWDKFTKLCRKLVCPVGHMPYYGSCNGLLDIYGYGVALQFELIINEVTIVTNSKFLLLQILENRINDELGNDINCGKCSAELFSSDNSGPLQIIFRYEIFTNEKCPYDVLMQRLRQIALKKEIALQFRYQNNGIHLTLMVLFGYLTETALVNMVAASPNYICNGKTYLEESILKHCPAVMLSKDEVSKLDLNNVSYVLSHQSHTDNYFQSDMYQVCVDTYFSAKQARSSATYVVTCFTVYKLHAFITISIVSLTVKYGIQF